MRRRELTLDSFDKVISEVSILRDSGYDSVAGWSLGKNCEHLTTVMRMSMEGFTFKFPWPMRVIARWMFFNRMMQLKKISIRVPAPKALQPPVDCDDNFAVDRLKLAIEEIRDERTTFVKAHPAMGKITAQQWRQFHLWHCSHHLSFLLPAAEKATAANVVPTS